MRRSRAAAGLTATEIARELSAEMELVHECLEQGWREALAERHAKARARDQPSSHAPLPNCDADTQLRSSTAVTRTYDSLVRAISANSMFAARSSFGSGFHASSNRSAM